MVADPLEQGIYTTLKQHLNDFNKIHNNYSFVCSTPKQPSFKKKKKTKSKRIQCNVIFAEKMHTSNNFQLFTEEVSNFFQPL